MARNMGFWLKENTQTLEQFCSAEETVASIAGESFCGLRVVNERAHCSV